MRRDFVTVASDEEIVEAFRLMRFARLRHVLVEENGALVGIVSFRDIQEQILDAGGVDVPRGAVAAAMTGVPWTVTPETPLRDVAARLCHLHIGCLPVVDGASGRPALLGIVTETDLLRAAFR